MIHIPWCNTPDTLALVFLSGVIIGGAAVYCWCMFIDNLYHKVDKGE